jgi:hypothetical protein
MSEQASAPVRRGQAVLSATPVRAGCVEVALDCGHRVRRRFGLCVPDRLPCPVCSRIRPSGAAPAGPD